jgi:hypothetical protein
MLEEFAPDLFTTDGPIVPFLSFPYPTRMAVIRMDDGGLWVWSPVALSPDLAQAVDALGPVRHIVAPNKLHHLFLAEWSERWPDARLYAPPGLAKKRPELHFDAELQDEPDSSWATEIDQTIFRGSLAIEEVVFFHHRSRTALVCDLVQRLDSNILAKAGRLKGLILRLNALVGDAGSTPREWRASFLRRGPAREAREKVLAWKPEHLLIAHGACARSKATEILTRALAWI